MINFSESLKTIMRVERIGQLSIAKTLGVDRWAVHRWLDPFLVNYPNGPIYEQVIRWAQHCQAIETVARQQAAQPVTVFSEKYSPVEPCQALVVIQDENNKDMISND